MNEWIIWTIWIDEDEDFNLNWYNDYIIELNSVQWLILKYWEIGTIKTIIGSIRYINYHL